MAASMRYILRSIGITVALIMLCTSTAFGETKMLTRYIPGLCYVENDSVAIETLNMDTLGQGAELVKKREFVFDAKGITFKRPPIATAMDYERIVKIRYVLEPENERGFLSVIVSYRDGNDTEELGYVQTACWNALLDLFKRKNVDVKIEVESAEKNQKGQTRSQ